MKTPLGPALATALCVTLTLAHPPNGRFGRRLHDPGKRTTPPESSIAIIAPGSSATQTRLINAMATSLVVSAGVTMTVVGPANPTGLPLASGTGPASLAGTQTLTLEVPGAAATGLGGTCGQKGTQALIQCLYDNSGKDCTNNGGGCGVLARYLPISADDKSACFPDVQVAAEVCAQCNATKAGYDLYTKYLDTCFALYPAYNLANPPPSGSVVVPGAATATGAAMTGGTGAMTTSTAVVAAGVATTVVVVTGPSATGPAAVATGTGAVVANEGLLTGFLIPTTTTTSSKAGVVGYEGTAPVQPTISAAIPTLPAGGVAAVEIGSTALPSNLSATGMVPPLVAATTTGQPLVSVTAEPSATSSVKPQLALALAATELFFAHTIDPGCGQVEDGCPVWEAAGGLTTTDTICSAANFKGAVDCSSCVGAAGRSDPVTYKAQMEAYGWYRNNCTLATGAAKPSGSANPLNALEVVDPANTALATGAAGTPVALAANAPNGKAPTVQYVEDQSVTPLVAAQGGAGRRREAHMGLMLLGMMVAVPLLLM